MERFRSVGSVGVAAESLSRTKEIQLFWAQVRSSRSPSCARNSGFCGTRELYLAGAYALRKAGGKTLVVDSRARCINSRL
jgi:hypothetical protein